MEVRNAFFLLLDGDRLAPTCRSSSGAFTPIRRWRHYGDHQVAPICRSRIGAITTIGDTFLEVREVRLQELKVRPGRILPRNIREVGHRCRAQVVHQGRRRPPGAFGDEDALRGDQPAALIGTKKGTNQSAQRVEILLGLQLADNTRASSQT